MTGTDPDDGPDRDGFEPDAEKREFLREIAREVREESDAAESEQVAAFLHRVSDLYDPAEDADPKHVYVNMREILRVKERGGRDG